MHRNRYRGQHQGGRVSRGGGGGGYNRGGRGGNRGWMRNRGFNDPKPYFESYGGGNRYHKEFSSNPTQWLNRQKREKRDTPGKRLSEDLIGVTEYMSDHKGFSGIIKSRYSDFQVSEINEKGEVAKLTSMEPPPRPKAQTVDEDEDLLLNKYNLEILPMETWDKINSLAVNTATEGADDSVEIDMEGVDKQQRTKIHDAVKKAFGDSIVGSTINVDNKKFMRFQKYRKGIRVDNRVKWVWPGDYVYFIVHKENCDTMEAAVQIAGCLSSHVKARMLLYAGTKDRRAKTSQWFSVRRVDPAALAVAGARLTSSRLYIGNYCFGDKDLKLGMLTGNKFRIALRNVTATEDVVNEACQHLKEHGFINYYGLQRFGSRVDTPTYNIGLKLLQGNFNEAIDLILQPREGPLQYALETYARSGAAVALRHLPRGARGAGSAPHHYTETCLIRALATAPNDLVGALAKVARNLRLLYIHSYQSLVWNRAVSQRLRRFGLRPAVGDCVPASAMELEESDEELDMEDNDEEESTQDTDKKQEGTKTEDTNIKDEKKSKVIPVKILTQEDVDSGKYTIFDIVLPLPGASVEYPPNMTDFYEDMLTKDGLTMDMKHKIRGYSMSGTYRFVSVRPRDVQWTHARYTDPYADLLLSDWDEMQHKEITSIIPDGKYKALLLTMTLPPSCYATMALRELLKVDTSSDNQAAQNNYHLKKSDDNKSGDNRNDKSVENDIKEEIEKDAADKVIEEMDSDIASDKRKLDNASEGVVAKKLKTDE